MKRPSAESEEVVAKFAGFEICHHCKQLYERQFLVGCSYRSSKMGFPISTPAYSDPYLQQIIESTWCLTQLIPSEVPSAASRTVAATTI